MINQNYNLTEKEIFQFCDLIRKKSGLEIKENRHSDLDKAVIYTANKYDYCDFEKFYKALNEKSSNNEALQTLIEQLTIGETSFMRNQPQIEALEKYILPEIFERNKKEKKVRVWSAGCSTGEEPYSLAILINRFLKSFKGWDVKILGTDINTKALKKAQSGIYSEWSFRNVTTAFREENFNPSGNLFQVLPEYQQMVEFAYLNLISSDYTPVINNTNYFDLILCKNVFLYFSEDNSRKVIDKFFGLLADPGWLLVGPSETSQILFEKYLTYNFPSAIVYKKSSRNNEDKFCVTTATPISPGEMKICISPDRQIISFNKEYGKEDKFEEESHLPLPKNTLQVKFETSDPSNKKRSVAVQKDLIKEYEEDKENHLVAYQLAKKYANQNEFGLAAEWIRKTIERNSLFAPVYYLDSLIMDELGDLDQSIASIRRCLYLEPKFLMGYYRMAELYKKTGDEKRYLKTLLVLEKELAQLDEAAEIPESEGLTAIDLLTFVKNQKELLI